MTEKNDFKLDVVSIRLVKEAPIYSEQSFNKPEEVAAVMGECMCQFDREVVCVVNLSSDLKPINVHFASVGSLNEAMAHPRELFKSSILSNAASMMLIHCHPSGNIFPRCPSFGLIAAWACVLFKYLIAHYVNQPYDKNC